MKSSSIKVQAILSNLPLFSDMRPEDLERIAAGTQILHADKGETIVHRGEACTGFHVVVYGQVKLGFTSPQGAEKVVDIIGPKQSFGEGLMFLEKPYIVTAQALADCLLLHVSKTVVFRELEADPSFARRMLAGISRRLHALVNDVEAYSLRSGTQRVIGFLLRGAPSEDVGENAFDVALPANKNIIASRLNLTPEHFSRILHELAAASLIEVEGRTVHVLDLARLRKYE